jgi:hypothetical protein
MILRKCAIQDLDLLAQSRSMLEPCASCVEVQAVKRYSHPAVVVCVHMYIFVR